VGVGGTALTMKVSIALLPSSLGGLTLWRERIDIVIGPFFLQSPSCGLELFI
jgi:hypothetical protein